jgi:hypothetical protein
MSDLMGMFSAMAMGAAPKIGRTVVEADGGTLIVSTVDSWDMGPETAIIDAERTHIVERYVQIEEAKEGHEKWVLFAKTAKEVTDVGYGDLIEPRTKILVPRNES